VVEVTVVARLRCSILAAVRRHGLASRLAEFGELRRK